MCTVGHKSNDLGLEACCALGRVRQLYGFTKTATIVPRQRYHPELIFFFLPVWKNRNFQCWGTKRLWSVFDITSCTRKRITLIAPICTIQNSQKHLLIVINGNSSNQSSENPYKYRFVFFTQSRAICTGEVALLLHSHWPQRWTSSSQRPKHCAQSTVLLMYSHWHFYEPLSLCSFCAIRR